MTIYVSLKLWRCICIEMKDSRRKLPIYSIYSSKKLVSLVLQTFESFVQEEDIAAMKSIVPADIFLYDIDIIDGSMIGEFARISVGKPSNTVRLLRYISHICYVSNNNALLKT